MAETEPDPFDELLNLEEKFYNEGYQLGMTDGEKAGRLEGRAFGIEKGFEKFVEAGRLHGKSLVLIARSPGIETQKLEAPTKNQKETDLHAPSLEGVIAERDSLPLLQKNARLEKHIRTLYALTEPQSLSTENTEEAVSDFDDRLKRAQARAKIIERLIREKGDEKDGHERSAKENKASNGEANIEDVSILQARH